MSKLKKRLREDGLLVCRKCLKKQRGDADVGDEDLYGWLKRQAAENQLPVSKCKCLDLCPDDGVALAMGGRYTGRKPLHVVKNGDEPARVQHWLEQRSK